MNLIFISTALRISSSRKSTTLSESAHLVNQHGSKNLHITTSHTSTPLWGSPNLANNHRCENLEVSQHIVIVARNNYGRKTGSAAQNCRAERHLMAPTVLYDQTEAVCDLSHRTSSLSDLISFPFSIYAYNIHKLCTTTLLQAVQKKGTQRKK